LRGAIGSGKSSVAARIKALTPSVDIIEVDDVKRRKYGTSTRCNPPIDFPEAGRQAKLSLIAGRDAIVVEPLCEREHVLWVVGGAGLEMGSADLRAVWLDCDLKTSLERKADGLPAAVIRQQHDRYASRFKIPGECVISSVAVPVNMVADAVIASALSGHDSTNDHRTA
jgi:hypothetical protein